mmetsp:Transcript_13750/g.41034  ORF Transcript_13750/g.41034 Transcript_13750/m.41034 type:complete len:174 (+) Transcript_13750:52-573(+)
MIIVRDSSRPKSGQGWQFVTKHGAVPCKDDVNGLPVKPPLGFEPLPPPPQLPPQSQLVSGALFGKKVRKAKVQVDDHDPEEVWIDGERGPMWVKPDGRVWHGPDTVGRWGNENGQHGAGRHWADLGTSGRKTALVITGKHQREVRLQLNISTADMSQYVRKQLEAMSAVSVEQ